eukprot:2243964-Pyramimonas_sp.AAC.2
MGQGFGPARRASGPGVRAAGDAHGHFQLQTLRGAGQGGGLRQLLHVRGHKQLGWGGAPWPARAPRGPLGVGRQAPRPSGLWNPQRPGPGR